MSAFIEGALAGFGIAIPVGAIAVLLIDLGIRRGFNAAAAAGLGAASADLFYAGIAVVLGSAIAEILDPYQETLRVVSGLVLFAVAAFLLRRALAPRVAAAPLGRVDADRASMYYGRFLGLTILNPATVTYFVALTLGLDKGSASTPTKIIFVGAVFLASASWQLFLAAIGAFLHRRLPENARTVLGIVGVLVVAGLALRLLLFPR